MSAAAALAVGASVGASSAISRVARLPPNGWGVGVGGGYLLAGKNCLIN